LELLGGGIHIAAVLQRARQFHTQLNIIRFFGARFLQIVDGGRPVMQARFHITELHARDVAIGRDLEDLLKILRSFIEFVGIDRSVAALNQSVSLAQSFGIDRTFIALSR
jgi:hypothetical protein